jgi:hypothetical protein
MSTPRFRSVSCVFAEVSGGVLGPAFRVEYRFPLLPLAIPDGVLKDWNEVAVLDWRPPFENARKMEQSFLDVGRKKPEVHDLGQACSRNMTETGQMRHVPNMTLLEFFLETNRQRHESGNPRDASRLDRGGRFRGMASHQALSAMLRISDVA